MCWEIFSWLFSVATNADRRVFAHLGWGQTLGIWPDGRLNSFQALLLSNEPKRVVAVDNT